MASYARDAVTVLLRVRRACRTLQSESTLSETHHKFRALNPPVFTRRLTPTSLGYFSTVRDHVRSSDPILLAPETARTDVRIPLRSTSSRQYLNHSSIGVD